MNKGEYIMKKVISLLLALVMVICCVSVSAYASDDDEIFYEEELLRGLSDPSFTKTTDNYDGYHFVKGTKAVWTCALYDITATATKVSGNNVTFDVKFNSHIPEKYLHPTSWDCSKYEIMLYANSSWKTFYMGDTMSYTVDTSKSDGLSTSATCGMQFFRIKVKKHERNTINVPTTSKYFEGIKKNREVGYGAGGAINEFWIEDTYTLGYYVSPDYVIYKNNYRITKNSITLGTYAFESIVEYRAKGAKSWKKKTFKKNKKMILKKLKAATTYQIHPLCKIYFTDPETGEKKYTIDQVASIFSLTTIINKKPKVTSIKISKIKYGKKTINGYWESDGDWHPTETFNTASYTITVKVKKVPKKIKGLVLKIGGSAYYAKGNKKTYTYKLTYQDTKKVKGKKMTAYFAYSSNSVGSSPLGIGPAKKGTYKIKKGTYKVK